MSRSQVPNSESFGELQYAFGESCGSWRHSEEKTIYESTYGLPIRFHQYNQVGVADNTCTSYT
ncbi:hypothetical protein GCM10009541_50210 [Micromonospora gifhornensis]|uniref:Uncharacterized protein n=1 Tax=Micromonospora gifhornensis TaxID=84594 RepID=A0ABQ4IMZ3_9ACTN|nr:hypothetical protein Vgi01_59630 [Micromonospora gifhornensis]